MGLDRPARWATFALMVLTYAACEVAADPRGRVTPVGVGVGLGLFALAAGLAWWFPRPAAGRGRPPVGIVLLLLGLFALPFLTESTLRDLTDGGRSLEMQMVFGLRNLGLGLAAAAAWPVCRRAAGVVALFLVLFVSAMGDQPAIPYLMGAMAVVGGIWLVINHQADLAGGATGVADGAAVERVRMTVPVRELLVFGALAAAAVGVAVAGPGRVLFALGELVPTSGGTGDQDPFARYGTNDGQEETTGANPNSAGMVDTDQFIESQQDSLIDVATDMYYGPPHKARIRDRMLAGGVGKVKESHDTAENRRPSRDFDTARQSPSNARKPDSQSARAVIEIEGRTPLHVRVTAYDRYDTADRRWAEAPKPGGRAVEQDPEGNEWMIPIGRNPGGWYAADDRHALKAAALADNLVPTPPLLSRVRIRRVDRAEYFEPDFDGVLALAGRKRTPAGTVVRTACRTVDPAALPAAAFPTPAGAGFPPAYWDVPPALAPRLSALAREWAGDRPRGWPQVNAVLTRLRCEHVAAREAVAPPDHPDPVGWFLSESRRGPDYLFATSAALLLRSLGYPTRVCVGFYAAPDALDPETQHTPVRASDVHTWPELLLADGQWLVVEPTPGYGVLPPLAPWSERATAAARDVADWAVRHAAVVGGLAIVVAALVWRRNTVRDVVYTLAWRLAPGRTWQQAALRAVGLFERRTRLAGRPRPPTQTLAVWAGGFAAGSPDPELGRLIRLAEAAAYAPALPPPVPAGAVPGECRRVLGVWTLKRLRSLGQAACNGGTI